jgi:hypothetical protein
LALEEDKAKRGTCGEGKMIGLFLSQVILYAAAGILGLALGWRLFALVRDERRRVIEREIDQLRMALSEAQVRRARGS